MDKVGGQAVKCIFWKSKIVMASWQGISGNLLPNIKCTC
jgi:hypothetical protein